MGAPLEPFDKNEIDGRHARQQIVQIRFGTVTVFVHQRPTLGRRDHDFACAGGAVLKGILARLVDIEGVMGVFHGRYRQPTGDDDGQEPNHQGGLAAPRKPRKTEDFHCWSVTVLRRSPLARMWARPPRR